MTKALRQALYSKIAGAPSVTSLLASASSVYHAVAPPQAAYPLIIFHQQSGVPTYTFADRAWDNTVWLVKAVATASTSDAVDDIAAALDALLTEGSLTISGGTLFDIRRQSDVQYVEVEDGEQIRHAGALYRIAYL